MICFTMTICANMAMVMMMLMMMKRQGQDTMEELKNQRGIFGRIQGVLGKIGQQFPQANGLIKKIQDKQNRDTVILAFVIASCMFFTVLYSW